MMKKTKLFTLGGIILLSLGSLTGCIEPDDEEVKDDSVPSDTGSGDPTDSSTDTSTSFTVTLNGLQSLYRPTDTISFSDVSLTLTYDDLTTVTLSEVEYDVETRASEDTEFILYTDGLYNAVTTGDTIAEKTYSLSYLIYLEEETTDEEGKIATEVVTYSGVPTNQQSIVISAYPSQIYSVYEFHAPYLQETYEKNITESVREEGGSENEDKFFVEPDYYEVGDDNPFIYQPRVYLFNRTTSQFEFPDNFPMDFKVSHFDSETESDETLDLAENDYVSLSGYSFQFTEAAVGEVFTISASLTDFTTDMVGNPLDTYTFTVKVEDGWNINRDSSLSTSLGEQQAALDLGRMNLTREGIDDGNTSYNLDADSYNSKGRDFYSDGTPGGYQVFANHYWVDQNGSPVFDGEELCTDPDVQPSTGDHVEYSLTRDPLYDSEGYEDEYFAYRVHTDEYWYNFLESKGLTDLHEINGIYLHTNIKITEDNIPDEYRLSYAEAYALGPHSGEGIAAFGGTNYGDIISAIFDPLLGVSEDGSAYNYDDLDGAIRDRSTLYLHLMDNDFTLNGNLFEIDASDLKWCMNNVFLSEMNFYYTDDTAFVVQSNACFMEFNYDRESTHPDYNSRSGDGVWYDPVPLATVENVRYAGNTHNYTQADKGDVNDVREGRQITNAEFASGSLSFLKSESAQTKVDNVICHDANIAFWPQTFHENDELYCMEVTNTKTYDCYTTAFYNWLGGNVKIEHSEFKRFGGPFSICISAYEGSGNIGGSLALRPHDYTYYYTDDEGVNWYHTDAWGANIIIGDDVTVESYVGGTESWFVLNNATSVVTQVKGYDYLLRQAGKTMVASDDPDDDNYGKFNLKGLFMDTTYILSGSYELHGSYVSSISDNYWDSYAIDSGADTEMQHYIDEYAKWYDYTQKVLFFETTYYATGPLIFTNTGNVFGVPDYDTAAELADSSSEEAKLYDLKAYESNGNSLSGTYDTTAKFDTNDTEMFMVLPLQAELGIGLDDVPLTDIILDYIGLSEGDDGYTIVKIAIDAVVSSMTLSDLLRLDLDLSEYGIPITITVGMADTLIGIVMDLYDCPEE